jgi:hypothetical protein
MIYPPNSDVCFQVALLHNQVVCHADSGNIMRSRNILWPKVAVTVAGLMSRISFSHCCFLYSRFSGGSQQKIATMSDAVLGVSECTVKAKLTRGQLVIRVQKNTGIIVFVFF